MLRRFPLALLLTGLLLVAFLPVARAPVTSVTVATDRSDYVVGMTVTANATIQFTSSFNQIDEPARVEWFDAAWFLQRVQYVAKVRVQVQIASASANWAPAVAGTYHVNVTANTTNGTPPRVWGHAAFRVWASSDYVIAQGIEVGMLRAWYERAQLATAVANLTANPAWVLGNVSRLERVRFLWSYPNGTTAHQSSVGVMNGEASDAWTPDIVGANYTVLATYLGNDTVSNSTKFAVFGTTTPAANVTAGASATWGAAQSPWRVCGDLTVAATATLTVEAGVTVEFCRGSRLLVAGMLTGNGTPEAPITLTSYEVPRAPGDWAGVHFVRGSSGRLVRAVVEDVTDGIAAEDSSLVLAGLVARAGTGVAVNFTRSSGSLKDAAIAGFAVGVRLRNATATLRGVSVVGGGTGVSVEEASGVVLTDVHVDGGDYGLQAVESDDVLVDGGSFTNAAVRGVDLAGSAATFANVSIAGAGQVISLVASVATLLNCSFADLASKRTIVAPSRLVIQNYLAVKVTAGDVPLEGARVDVAVNGAPLTQRTTDPRGLVEWIVVEDRAYNATGVVKATVVVTVTRQDYTVAGSPRTVDMATSHTEAFSATANALGGTFLVLAGIVLAALLLATLLIARRRPREEAPGGGVPSPEPAMAPLASVPGTGYAILAEKADRAFERFASDIRSGKPGLCISRTRPEEVHVRYGLEGVPVYWLSRSPRADALRPTNLVAVVDLVRKQTAGRTGCRVLLDGLEYLVGQNDFGKVAKFVHELVDVVAEQGAVLLLPINPKSFDPDRLSSLTRDLHTLI